MLDALDRVLRHGGRAVPGSPEGGVASAAGAGGPGAVLLAVHLSRVTAAGPRAYHRRMVTALLDEAAGREGGQLFSLGNGDVVVLFRPGDGGASIAATMASLFMAEMPDAGTVRTVWPLPAAAVAALTYVRDRVLDGAGHGPAAEPQASAAAIDAMQAVVRTAPLEDLTRRQTAILLRPGHVQQVTPLFREVVISTAVLEGRGGGVHGAAADPFLFSHLAGRLDRRMLTALRTDIAEGGPLSGRLGEAALHLNLTLPGVLSQGFAAMADAARPALARGLRIGVEIPFAEVYADSQAFVLARERLRLSGCDLVLDGVTHGALPLTCLGALDPGLVKLSWSPALPGAGSAVRRAIERIGPERLVLHRTDSERAVAWGLGIGIARFQGHYIDVMLAAERVKHCARRVGCTMRQCADRAGTTAAAARVGCGNPGLLDTALPVRTLEAA